MGLAAVESVHGSLEMAIRWKQLPSCHQENRLSIPRTRTYFEFELLLARHEHAYQAFDYNTQGKYYTLVYCVQE